MGSVRITETSQVGDAYSSVEYEFSDSVDFLAWQSDREERLSNAVKSFVGGYGLYPEGSDINGDSDPAKPFIDINVKKKDTKH